MSYIYGFMHLVPFLLILRNVSARRTFWICVVQEKKKIRENSQRSLLLLYTEMTFICPSILARFPFYIEQGRPVHNIYIVMDVYTPEVFISFQFCRYIIQFFFFPMYGQLSLERLKFVPQFYSHPSTIFFFRLRFFSPFSRPLFCK